MVFISRSHCSQPSFGDSDQNTTSEIPTQHGNRIQTLTSLLDRHAISLPISNIDLKNVETNEELRSYYYLATLLTTGSHEQNCAVTAILLPGLVKCIIVHVGETKSGQDAMSSQPLRAHRIQERQIDIKTLGSAPWVFSCNRIFHRVLTSPSADSDPVDFEVHAADLLHALRTFHSELHCYSGTSPYWHFLRFIVRRCHCKIAERMLNGEKIWKKHPMAVLRDWDPGNADFPRQEFTIRHQILEAVLSLYGISGTREHGDGAIFHFATHNAKAWAQTACALYGTLEKKLFTPSFQGGSLKDKPRATMDLESIIVVADYLDTLLVLLDLPPLKAILTHRSYASLLEPLNYQPTRSHSSEKPTDGEFSGPFALLGG